jgi:hypothetical protein
MSNNDIFWMKQKYHPLFFSKLLIKACIAGLQFVWLFQKYNYIFSRINTFCLIVFSLSLLVFWIKKLQKIITGVLIQTNLN